MRSGLLFKLPLRKPNIFLNAKRLFGYTFLESEHLDDALRADPGSEPNKSIIELIKTPFTGQDLQEASFLNEKVKQHLEHTQSCFNSLTVDKYKIAENINQLANKNILDIEIWKKVFAQVLELRYDELQDHPQLDEMFRHMEAFFSRFDIKNSKFYLDKRELPGIMAFRQNCANVFNRKNKLGSIRLQTSTMNFFTKASTKIPVNLDKMRKYYQDNLISNLEDVLAQENNIVDVAKLQSALDALYLAESKTRQIFSKRVTELMSREDSCHPLDPKEYQVLATNWACLGEMRQPYGKIFSDTFDSVLQESPAALLQAVVTCNKETPQLLERLFSTLARKSFQTLSRKPEIHRVIHILSIRGYDFSKYSEFVQKICEENCDKLNHKIFENINVPIRSRCMQPEYYKDTTSYSPNIEYKWVSSILRSEFGSKMTVFGQTKVCRFDVLFGFIKNGRIYVLQITDLNRVNNRAKNYRGTIQQKRQLFSYYGIEILELELPLKQLSLMISKKDKMGLIKEVEAVIQKV